MAAFIVQTSQSVTLVGAGQASKADLDLALAYAPYLIAADGGAELVLNYGRTPKKVIGDLDSIDPDHLAQIPSQAIHHIKDQNSTDFDKCLRNISAPLILAIGFMGGRLDHQLATLNSLVRHRGPPCILLGDNDVVFHLRHDVTLPLAPGARLSLLPLAKTTVGSTGLEWEVDAIDFEPAGDISISNRVTTGPVSLRYSSPGMLVVLSRSQLSRVVPALCAN